MLAGSAKDELGIPGRCGRGVLHGSSAMGEDTTCTSTSCLFLAKDKLPAESIGPGESAAPSA